MITVERKTKIDKNASTVIKFDETDLISKEQVMVCVSKDGYLKRATIKAYNASKSNGLKENDSVLFLGEVSTLDTLLMFTTLGNFIYLPVHKISECKFKDVGTYINSVVAIAPKEKIISCFNITDFNDGKTLVLVTKYGSIKQTLLSEFSVNRYTKPVRAMKISGDDELAAVDIIDNPLEIMVFTKRCEALRFRASDVSLYGCNAGGVKAINLKPKDEVVSCIYTNKEDDFLILTNRSTLKRMRVTDVVLTKRSRAGSQIIKPVKSKPIVLTAACKLTPNQFKENLPVYIRYKNGNDEVEAKSLKYNVSDLGRSILNEEYSEPQGLSIPNPNTPDSVVSGDYLIEVRETLFNYEDGSVEEKPITISKKQDNILDELDKILAMEKEKEVKITEGEKYIVKETKSSLFIREKDPVLKIDESEDEHKEIVYRRVSLFDEED